jgi:uncharacterized protein (DUF1810 family)
MFDLARFRKAQDEHPGLQEALAELRAGEKTGHWIWYVFPQLRGLGRSPMAVRFGLDGVGEAIAYLGDLELSARLVAAAELVEGQIAAGASLNELMGSEIDVQKLVSSMTLFGALGEAPERLAACARNILQAAQALGYPPCAFTKERLRSDRRG